MQVKLTQAFIGRGDSFAIDQVIDVESEFATELLNADMAVAVKLPKKEVAVTKFPETPEVSA